jgi:hypothetical protein
LWQKILKTCLNRKSWRWQSESLAGISRLTFQMSVADLPHAKLLQAIELLGTRVAPLVRAALASDPTAAPSPTHSHAAA